MPLARTLALLLSLLLVGCGRPSATTPPEPAVAAEPPPVVPASPPAVEPPTVEEPLEPPVVEPAPAVEEPPAALTVLTEPQQAIFFGSPQDPAPDFRGGVTKAQENKHYLAGNERTPQAFYEAVKDKGVGGGYVGVGTDQAYLFMSWARPDIVWLIDYDPAVLEVHELYRTFFLGVQTPEEFIALWDKPGREAALALIEAEHDARRTKTLRRWYLGYRGWIHRRLAAVKRTLGKAKVPSYLDNQADYDFIRERLQQRRVRPLLANLLDRKGVVGVAQSAEQLGVEIRILYLSNAEEYWKAYTKRFKDNIAALPFADDALVLRTLLIWSVNNDYRYNVQSAANFLRWLEQPYIDHVYDMTHARPKADPEIINFFETTGAPEDSPAARRYAKARASGQT